MILSLRHIRRRIKSVENTKKMTRAMEMVAAAKLKRLQESLKQSDRYIGELKRILAALVRETRLAHPLLEKRPEPKSTLVFLITSDTGLCGSYNTNILELAGTFLTSGRASHFITVGRQGAAYLKRKRVSIAKELNVPRPQEIDETVRLLTQIASQEFIQRKADEVLFLYTKVESLASLKPTLAKLFPIAAPEAVAEKNAVVDYLLEPSLDEILERMVPGYIEAEVSQIVKHSLVAEQASRMLAMRQATDNAKKMVESLTLMRNKARQASITKELLEVVSGSRALQVK
jgi:F-type H+-transporting ATPase subunit gamma